LSVEYLARHSADGKKAALDKQKPARSKRGRQNITQISAQTVNISPPSEDAKDEVLQLAMQERVEKVRKLRIQNAIARGQYIQREVVRLWGKMLFSVLLAAFRDLDERIMPTISAACRSASSEAESIAKGGAILRKELHDGLDSVGKAAADFHDEPPDPAQSEFDAGDSAEGLAMD
jgi:hypothetical protein